MNISILSLISSSLISKSPLFVSNHMIVANCHFQKFTSLLFYNQPFYHLHKTIFNKGLDGIVKFENVINRTEVNITDDSFYGNYSRIVYHDPIQEPIKATNSIKAAHIITFCQFIGIESNDPIIHMNKNSSSYFSDVLFYNCKANQHLIKFDNSRCNTMTHICSYNNIVDGGSEFIYSDFSKKDFFIIIYSTFVGSNSNSLCFIESKSGSQYFKCINFSKYDGQIDAQVINIDAPYCCSSTYISFNDINNKLYKISGSIARGSDNVTDTNSNKTIYFESIAAWNQIHEDFFRLSMTEGNSFFLSVSNSVFISSVTDGTKTFVKFDDLKNNINNFILLTNCQFSKNIKAYDSTPVNFFMDANSFVTLDDDKIIKPEIAVYTTLHCNGIGNPNNPKLAQGCQVDNCVAQERCNSTIGIPSDAAPYETLIHTDIQSGTFTATSRFSPSNPFSFTSFFTNTGVFSYTDDFTKSSFFSFSNQFSGTDKFSSSTSFSKSFLFSDSNEFSNSINFSNSNKFTLSSQFSESTDFTKSTVFSYSSDFTRSTMFSKSGNFTESTQFSSSFYFTKSTQFSSSFFFSETTQFSSSSYFSKTTYFTKSFLFSESADFTKSTSFSDSSYFTKSFYFSQSTMFSKTKGFSYSFYFSSSDEFSKTDLFSKSTVFTQSNQFTPSDDWNRTHIFSPSSFFTSSNQFSSSIFFSLSNYFTKTDDFSRSITFTSSFDFTKSDNFLKSSEFSKSEYFSKSLNFFSTKTFIEKSAVIIDIKTENSSGMSKGVKIGLGLGVALGGAALVALIIGLILLRRRKLGNIENIDEEQTELFENETTSMVTQNPLMTLMDDDDPFEAEFK